MSQTKLQLQAYNRKENQDASFDCTKVSYISQAFVQGKKKYHMSMVHILC
jgi:hypothetical protein